LIRWSPRYPIATPTCYEAKSTSSSPHSLQRVPQSTLVWCSFDGVNVLLNTGIGYQKEKNMRRDPRISVFAVDPANKMRWIEVQGDAELIEEGALEHINQLSRAYQGMNFYDLMPELREKEVRVIVKMTPRKVRIGKG
jgi:PPOX class probable F420-dependent enzyme